MQIDIQARGFHMTAALDRYIRDQVKAATRAGGAMVSRVKVRLNDINGPRGGHDMRCRVHISVPATRDVVVEEVDLDMYAAIARATDRARFALHRRLARRHRRLTRPGVLSPGLPQTS